MAEVRRTFEVTLVYLLKSGHLHAVQLAKHEALNSRESLLADKLVDAPPEAAVQYREARAYRYFAIH